MASYWRPGWLCGICGSMANGGSWLSCKLAAAILAQPGHHNEIMKILAHESWRNGGNKSIIINENKYHQYNEIINGVRNENGWQPQKYQAAGSERQRKLAASNGEMSSDEGAISWRISGANGVASLWKALSLK